MFITLKVNFIEINTSVIVPTVTFEFEVNILFYFRYFHNILFQNVYMFYQYLCFNTTLNINYQLLLSRIGPLIVPESY